MALNFPPSDTIPDGYVHTDPSNGVSYIWDASRQTWTAQSSGGGGGGIPEPNFDGIRYSRRNGAWVRNDVTSVNARTGDVDLDAFAVGAATEEYVQEEIAKIDLGGILFRGMRDLTTEDPPLDSATGDMWESSEEGVIKNTWPGIEGLDILKFQTVLLGSDGNWIRGNSVQGDTGFRFRGLIDVTSEAAPLDSLPGDIWENEIAGIAVPGWGNLSGRFVEEFQNVILTDDGDWILGQIGVSEGISEAPNDGFIYGRQGQSWEKSVPEDTVINTKRVRYNGGWDDESVSTVNGQDGDVRITAGSLGAATEEWVIEQIGHIESEFNFKGFIDPINQDPSC